jgi:hypothetical protein
MSRAPPIRHALLSVPIARDIAQDRGAVRTDSNNIRTDARNIGADQRDIHADRQDLRTDRHDLRANGQDFRTANPAQTQQVARNEVHPGPQPVNAGKVQMTSATLANNAAENSKKTQNQQTTHKAWYHWIW